MLSREYRADSSKLIVCVMTIDLDFLIAAWLQGSLFGPTRYACTPQRTNLRKEADAGGWWQQLHGVARYVTDMPGYRQST